VDSDASTGAEPTFYVELKPTTDEVVDEALAVGGFTLAGLAATGVAPADAMLGFERWLAEVVPAGSVPVFVGFNAAFDWMFVADYFDRFLGRNPFGHAALDIKSYSMGLSGSSWAGTSLKLLSPQYLDGSKLSHNALGDAQDQARLFRALRAQSEARD
jgi:DNA polymerase III epsilon subunit-like protein